MGARRLSLAIATPILALAAITIAIYSTLASAVLGLAVFQLLSASWIYGRLPGFGSRPGWLPLLHRLAGATAILVSLPIAYHCMRAYGVQTFDARAAVLWYTSALWYYNGFSVPLLGA